MKQNIYDLNLVELQEKIVELGDKKYRAQQVFDAIYPTGVNSVGDIKNIPQNLQVKLDETQE